MGTCLTKLTNWKNWETRLSVWKCTKKKKTRKNLSMCKSNNNKLKIMKIPSKISQIINLLQILFLFYKFILKGLSDIITKNFLREICWIKLNIQKTKHIEICHDKKYTGYFVEVTCTFYFLNAWITSCIFPILNNTIAFIFFIAIIWFLISAWVIWLLLSSPPSLFPLVLFCC